MKAPFRLAAGQSPESLRTALADFARRTAPVFLPGLQLADLHGFFALVPAAPPHALDALAERVVRAFEPFRAPLTPDEIAKRRPERLGERQRRYLNEFGYPLVLEEFQFHMTLTDRLPPEERGAMRDALERVLPSSLLSRVAVDRLVLFCEESPGAAFTAEADFALEGPSN